MPVNQHRRLVKSRAPAERNARQALDAHPAMASKPAILGWLLFDWACQPFFTLVTTFVFAPYFAASLAPDPVTGQSLWGFATAAAGLLLAFLSPVLGSVADATAQEAVDRLLRLVLFAVVLRALVCGSRPG